MPKKNHIKVKRGLLEPKHRLQMGNSVWLYLYILDKTNWDSGTIDEWRDADVAEDMERSARTIRQHRQTLENAGYIACRVSQHKQIIYVHNWSNPREKWNAKTAPKDEPTEDYNPFKKWMSMTGNLSGSHSEEIGGWVDDWNERIKEYPVGHHHKEYTGEQVVFMGMEVTDGARSPSMNYFKKVMKNWWSNGIGSPPPGMPRRKGNGKETDAAIMASLYGEK